MVNPLWLKQEKDKMQLDKKIQIITGWVGIIATIIDLTNTVSQILLGVVASVMAALVTFLIEKVRRKK